MKFIRCQGKSFVTTDDVAHAVVNFSAAARKRCRVVIIDVPVVVDGNGPVVQLVLFPGEIVEVSESAMPDQELDTTPLIRSLANRRLAWLPHRAADE
ncbi:hypothetical protein [Agreia sp.]|uniref:hypothetical protein n=1 Tax=Agreia sp. TaxID=1872416 RepID=UPI0035BC8232